MTISEQQKQNLATARAKTIRWRRLHTGTMIGSVVCIIIAMITTQVWPLIIGMPLLIVNAVAIWRQHLWWHRWGAEIRRPLEEFLASERARLQRLRDQD